MKNLINKLTQTCSPSGYENEIREIILNEVESYADECTIDQMGNLFVKKNSKKKNAKKIMIAAHMDEIGVMASHIDKNGFVYIAAIGGVNPLTCLGGRVKFLNGTEGVIYAETEKMNKVPTFNQLFVDVGADSKESCPIRTGDIGVFQRPFMEIGNRWVSKTLDNRVGCLIAIETIKTLQDSPHDLTFVFTTQEEVGLRGASVAAYTVNPDMGIALDVTVSADTPFGEQANPVLGEGPCIKVRDNSLVASPKVIATMIDAAEKAELPYQMEVLRFAGTDAGAIQQTRSGVPSGCISVACRYVHSPSEMVDRRDVSNAIKLLTKILTSEIDI